MITEKEILGIVAIILDGIAHAPYIWMTLTKKTKPHMFSWIVWTITIGIAFAAQYTENAGPGAWVTGFATILSLIIVGLSMTYGEKNITRTDWISFVAALAAVPLWYFTKSPVGAVIWVTFIDVCGYYPTFRKSFAKPWQESTFLYGVAAMTSLTSVFALENMSFVTALYPAALTICNFILTLEILWRRTLLRKP